MHDGCSDKITHKELDMAIYFAVLTRKSLNKRQSGLLLAAEQKQNKSELIIGMIFFFFPQLGYYI